MGNSRRDNSLAFALGALVFVAGLYTGWQLSSDESPPVRPSLPAEPPPTNALDTSISEDELAWVIDRLEHRRTLQETADIEEGDTGSELLQKLRLHEADPSVLAQDFETFAGFLRNSPQVEEMIIPVHQSNGSRFIADFNEFASRVHTVSVKDWIGIPEFPTRFVFAGIKAFLLVSHKNPNLFSFVHV